MRKQTIKRIVLIAIVTVLSALALLFVFRPALALILTRSPQYAYRTLFWGESDIQDYEKFPYREVQNTPPAFQFKPANPSEAFQSPPGF